MVELSAFWQNYFTPTNGAVFVVEICFAHWLRRPQRVSCPWVAHGPLRVSPFKTGRGTTAVASREHRMISQHLAVATAALDGGDGKPAVASGDAGIDPRRDAGLGDAGDLGRRVCVRDAVAQAEAQEEERPTLS